MAESKEELKSLLMKVKEESEKDDLKFNIQKTKIMASGPITSWQIHGEKVETVIDCTFLGSEITVGNDCSHEIKMFVPWKEIYDKLRQHIKKTDISLLKNVCLVKAILFSSSHVWM